MAGILKHWREAASLILVSRSVVGSGKTKFNNAMRSHEKQCGEISCNLDILMIKRSTKSTFMPNIHVFPGGIADDADFSKDWLDLFSKIGTETVPALATHWRRGGRGAYMFSRERKPQFSYVPSELAFRICAIRETFEECGVLLARDIGICDNNGNNLINQYSSCMEISKQTFESWRQRVDNDSSEFITMCKELNILPDVWTLHEFSNWLTPTSELLPSKSRRYDTAFFVAATDKKPTVRRDKTETASSTWASPPELLHDFHNQAIRMAPPQLYELSRLLHFQDVNQLCEFNSQRSQRVECGMPIRCQLHDCLMYILPGDSLYPETPNLCAEGEVLEIDKSFEDLLEANSQTHGTRIVITEDGQLHMTLHCTLENPLGNIKPVLATITGRAKL